MRVSSCFVEENDPNSPRWSVRMRGTGNCDCGAGFKFATDRIYLVGFRTEVPAITVGLIDSLDEVENVCKGCGLTKRLPALDKKLVVLNFDIHKVDDIVTRLEQMPKRSCPEPFVD